MDNYIVRIYRQEKGKPEKLMGIVEKVGKKGKKAFTHMDELWEILNASVNSSRRGKIKKWTRYPKKRGKKVSAD